jgi:hypothetical protein
MSPDRPHSPPDPPPRARDLAQVADRLRTLEVTEAVHHTEVTGRLNAGAAAFSEVRAAVTDLQPRRLQWAQLAGFTLSIALVLGSIINTASTYVDRETLERATKELQSQDTELRDEVLAAKSQLLRAQLSLEQAQKELVELQRRFEAVLSQRASQPEPAPRGRR